jgi:hypothetical protein
MPGNAFNCNEDKISSLDTTLFSTSTMSTPGLPTYSSAASPRELEYLNTTTYFSGATNSQAPSPALGPGYDEEAQTKGSVKIQRSGSILRKQAPSLEKDDLQAAADGGPHGKPHRASYSFNSAPDNTHVVFNHGMKKTKVGYT